MPLTDVVLAALLASTPAHDGAQPQTVALGAEAIVQPSGGTMTLALATNENRNAARTKDLARWKVQHHPTPEQKITWGHVVRHPRRRAHTEFTFQKRN